MKTFNGAVVALTGAGSGIGRALAVEFASRGCDLALRDVDDAGLGTTREMLSAHRRVRTAHVDVADLEDMTRWRGTKLFMPMFAREPEANIVTISSLFGLIAPPLQIGYAASKFAVRGFAESLRHELGSTSVRMTTVHPGGVSPARYFAVLRPLLDPEKGNLRARRARHNVPSLQARLLRPILRAVIRRDLKANSHSLDAYVAAVRRGFELGAKAIPTARDIKIVPIETDDVRGEWLIRRDVEVSDRAILYIHGGGMIACRPPQYRSLTFPLARRTGVPVFSLNYRLAPEHPYPAALDDALAAYAALRRRIPAAGIVLAGDSAGGNLALATLLALREREGIAAPVAGVIAISPWTDLLGTGASIVANEHTEDLIVRPTTPGVTNANAYAPEALWGDPLVSPLYGDYTGAPPLLAFASRSEMLLDDSRALVARYRAQGGIATLVQGEELPHDWPVFAMLPEARAAHRTMADFVARILSPAAVEMGTSQRITTTAR